MNWIWIGVQLAIGAFVAYLLFWLVIWLFIVLGEMVSAVFSHR